MKSSNLRYRVLKYLSANDIKYKEEHFNGQLYLWFDMEAPDGIEASIRFKQDKLSVRCYYTSQVTKSLNNPLRIVEMLKVINYLNAEVIDNIDGVDIIPCMYLSMDGSYDIVLSAELSVNQLDLDDSLQYITVFMPRLMEMLAPALCGVALGLYPASTAIWQVRTDVLNEEDVVVEEFY